MAIYRGPGGPGDATADSANTAQLAEEFALDAANSATAAANSASSASNAATAAETSETNAGTSETNASNSAAAAATSATNASNSETAAASSASGASTSATNADTSATNAAASETNAASSASAASTAATNATSSALTASTEATNAANSATSSAASASAAATSETNAASSASASSTSATNASNSATAAAASETAAASSESAAASSEAAAAASEAAAATSESAAATSETNAAASASAASTSETNAAASETAAATSETNAATSESAAATSASAALTSETNAAASASAASTSASNADTSETNAAASASAAATSESNASTSASNAATSESNAATSETNASNSASAAATSASNAVTSETNAAASASAALTSETNAAASESAAATSETNASNSATASASSASAASTSETNAATSASNAATSETNAANSASAASTSVSNAATSESNAATSESNAATSASNAATSETNAAASESAALAAQAATEAVYDDFDDRYLGDKASDPTLDNDGNALLTGALYWNTTDNELKVYTGSIWSSLGAGGNPFNQNLNTTDSVTFAGLTVTGVSQTKKTNLVASGTGWDDGLNLYSADGTNRWNVLVDDGASDSFRIAYNNSEALQINTSRNVTAIVDIRSPIFYDSNDTGYYGDFASTSMLNTLQFGTSTNSGRFSGESDWGVRFITSSGYIWLGPANAGHAHIYTDRPNFYLNAPLTVNGGSIINTSDIRATIFYDSNDTGYYIDPNSTGSSALRMRGGALFGPNTTWGAYLYVGTNGNVDVNTATVAATNGNLHLDAANGYVMYLNNYATSSYTVVSQSCRSPIFYDLNDTGYYADLNSRTVTYAWTTYGRNYSHEWIELPNYSGIYSPLNGAHFYPNNVTYGSWRIAGTRNGWHGIHFDSGMTLMMNDQSCGVHREGQGWRFYVENTNLFCNGQIQAYWSDRRLKENFRPIESESLDILSKMTAYRFNWNKKVKELNLDIEVGKEEISLIAQEVQAILPDAVGVNKAGAKPNDEDFDYLTINYDRITPIVVQAINELRQRVEKLEHV